MDKLPNTVAKAEDTYYVKIMDLLPYQIVCW